MNRRKFIKYSIIASFFITQSLSAYSISKFRIPKNKEISFEKLRKAILFRPYNTDLIKSLISFNKENNVSSYTDPNMKELLMFIYSNTKNIETMNLLQKELENPTIQSEKEVEEIKKLKKENKSLKGKRLLDQNKELEKYRKKTFRDSYETAVFYRLSNNSAKEKELIARLETNDRSFNPTKEREIYYKIIYYIMIGNMEEANYTFKTIEKSILKEVEYKQKKALNKRKTKRRVLRRRNQEQIEPANMKEIYLMYISGLGSFLNRYNEDLIKKYSNLTRELAYPNQRFFYFYQMYSNFLIYEEYSKAVEYLSYIKENDPYTGIDNELFVALSASAIKNYKQHIWKQAWLSSKEAIIIGMSLDYKKYYKTVIQMKKIFKKSGLEYVKELLRTNNRDLAKEILDETNRILKLTKS